MQYPRPQPASKSRVEQVLAGLPHPLMVLRADRRLVFGNPGAERLFADGLASQSSQHLMSLGQLNASRLEGLLRLAGGDTPARAGLWFSPGLRTGWMSVSSAGATQGEWPDGALLLMVHLDQPDLAQGARIDALCQQCRLTPTERYVLMLLADGLSVEAAAQQLGLKLSTLRTHVRNLLGKTQAPSLMQLLRWLGSAAPLLH
jgi:DNA-binding CsgD family transcriptional regulator